MLPAIFSASVFACELALVALSFNLSYRVLGFANFAHVEYVTIGGLAAVSAAGRMPVYVAAFVGVATAGCLSLVLNVGIFQHFGSASVGTKMIASAALAIMIRGLEQMFWGVNPRRFPGAPPRDFKIDGAFITGTQLIIIGSAILCVVSFAAILRYTRVGRNVRAVADNPHLAEVHGVSTGVVRNQVCLIAGAIAGLAGVLFGIDSVVLPQLGITLLIPMFAACIVGGAGSPYGAIIGATLVSAATTASVSINYGHLFGFGSVYLGSQWKSVVAFSCLILVLAVRPTGFFGEQRRRV